MPDEPARPEKATAAQIRKSFKSLKRHLNTHALTPETYRAKWGLSSDCPMVAASDSAQRSELARSLGLGRLRRKTAAKAAAAAETATLSTKSRGRPRKAAETPVEAPKTQGRKKATAAA